jgi:glycosyltransferase involved in cell wall biosynthesis
VRVLLTVPSLVPAFGGPAAKIRPMAAALSAAGAEVRVVGCGEADGANGVPVLFSYHGTPVPRSFRDLRRLVRRADVVHVIGFRDPVGTAAAIAARRADVPYLLEPVGMHRPRVRNVLAKRVHDAAIGRWVVAHAAAFVATSRLEARELEADGVDPTKTHVRANGVDVGGVLPLPPRGGFRRELGVGDDVPLVLSLGRITRKKRLPDLVAAVARIPDAHVAIVGPPEDRRTLDEVRGQSRRLRAEDRVHVVPIGVWGNDRGRLFADADAFCIPSATENFGIAAAEAAAVGLPTVVSDNCGIGEWLDPASSRVVGVGDVAALSEALATLVHDAAARDDARRAAPLLRSALSWDRLATLQMEHYEMAMGRWARSA